jgi:hypothetical protein
MEKETESELSLKEREGDKRETEAGLETPKGRDLGLKEERARDEAEAAMGRRRDKAFRGFWVKSRRIHQLHLTCEMGA